MRQLFLFWEQSQDSGQAIESGQALSSAGVLLRRGVAVFEGGVPMRENSVRMLWGAGARAGLYPLSATEAYWFTTANAPAVRSSPRL